jgi:hypothetical protein
LKRKDFFRSSAICSVCVDPELFSAQLATNGLTQDPQYRNVDVSLTW